MIVCFWIPTSFLGVAAEHLGLEERERERERNRINLWTDGNKNLNWR